MWKATLGKGGIYPKGGSGGESYARYGVHLHQVKGQLLRMVGQMHWVSDESTWRRVVWGVYVEHVHCLVLVHMYVILSPSPSPCVSL